VEATLQMVLVRHMCLYQTIFGAVLVVAAMIAMVSCCRLVTLICWCDQCSLHKHTYGGRGGSQVSGSTACPQLCWCLNSYLLLGGEVVILSCSAPLQLLLLQRGGSQVSGSTACPQLCWCLNSYLLLGGEVVILSCSAPLQLLLLQRRALCPVLCYHLTTLCQPVDLMMVTAAVLGL
jgi:hypothetical protein